MLPEKCQSKEDGICRLPIGTCAQCESESHSGIAPTYSELRKAAYEYSQNEWKARPDLVREKMYAEKDFIEGGNWYRKQLASIHTETPPEGMKECICADCGKAYNDDIILPDEIWAKISPKPVGGYKGGGLLCGQCILNRIIAGEKDGIWDKNHCVRLKAWIDRLLDQSGLSHIGVASEDSPARKFLNLIDETYENEREKWIIPFTEREQEKLMNAINLAQAEIRAVYKRLDISNSNVLQLLDDCLSERPAGWQQSNNQEAVEFGNWIVNSKWGVDSMDQGFAYDTDEKITTEQLYQLFKSK